MSGRIFHISKNPDLKKSIFSNMSIIYIKSVKVCPKPAREGPK